MTQVVSFLQSRHPLMSVQGWHLSEVEFRKKLASHEMQVEPSMQFWQPNMTLLHSSHLLDGLTKYELMHSRQTFPSTHRLQPLMVEEQVKQELGDTEKYPTSHW
jgi:hypothetical protein